MTSAFLQVLATIHRVEASRSDRPRNVLQVCRRCCPPSPPFSEHLLGWKTT